MLYHKHCVDCDKIFKTTAPNTKKCTRCRDNSEGPKRKKWSSNIQKEAPARKVKVKAYMRSCESCGCEIADKGDDYCFTCYYQETTGKKMTQEALPAVIHSGQITIPKAVKI